MTCTRAREADLAAVLHERDSEASRSLLGHCESCASCAAELARYARLASRRSASRFPGGLALGLIAALAGALLVLLAVFSSEDGAVRPGPAALAKPVPEPEGPRVEPPPPAAPAVIAGALADLTLVSGEDAEIPAGSLPADRPLALDLQLGEPSATGEPLSGRMITEGREPLELRATIHGEDRSNARIEISTGWLSPGRYIIELHTTEHSHFPLRRYALEVQ